MRQKLWLLLGLIFFAAACQQPALTPTPTVENTPVAAATPASTPTTAPTLPPPPSPTHIPLLPSDLAGSWIGGYVLPDQPANQGYLVLTLNAEGDTLTGQIFYPLAMQRHPVTDLTLAAGEMTFAAGSLQVTLAPDGAALKGTVTQGQATSPFHLLRLGEATPESLSVYTGLYAAADDHIIGLYIGDNQFWVRDFQTGRMGILRPLADGTFLLGSGLQLYYPFVATLTFTADNTGQINTLTWTPGDGSAPVTASRIPPTYSQEEVTFSNGDVTLAGTLLIPEGPGPHPATVMIHGSDPARRTSGFYRAWADWLVHQGLAVLLYDKRGVGDSTGRYAEFASDSNLDNLAGDALAGVQMLKTRPEIDPARIGIQGPSQAGWVGPRIAAQSPDVAFMVMLVGPTVSPSQESLQEQLEVQRRLGANSLTDEEITTQILAAGPSGFDPVDYLEPLTIPVLWLYGGRDRSIPTYASMAILEQLDKPNFTIELFPTGNHGLFDAQTGWDDEFPYLPGAVPGLFTTIETWLAEVVFKEPLAASR